MSLTEQELTEIVAAVKAELRAEEPTPLVIDQTHFQVVTGQVIEADHVNSLANQSVPKYPNMAALTADWAAPSVGALAYLQDINAMVVFDSPITGGANVWHVAGGLRMGYAAASGGQSIPASTDTLVTMAVFGGAANKPGRGTWGTDGTVTVPLSGTYLVSGNLTWPVNATGERRLYVKRYTAGAWSFGGVSGGAVETNVAGSTFLRQSVTAMVACVAGDKVGMFGRQNSGAALALVGGADQPHLGVHMLGAE